MNALHHVPSYAAALREIHRVLKPGGRAVFSEPGTAHAVQPLSQFRMREESIIEKNVALPLVRRLATEAGFSKMRVVPLRSSAAYVFEYAGGPRTRFGYSRCGTNPFAAVPPSMPASCCTRATIRPQTRFFRRISSSDDFGLELFQSGQLRP